VEEKMAFWSKKEPEFEEMAELIEEQPGISASEVARQLGVSTSTVTRRLPSMDEAGILLFEDETGGLWPFGKHK
jgi:Mn-dependent DtxR family transcriptional regulator